MDTILISLPAKDVASLRKEQPGLKYDPASHQINGLLLVSAEYSFSTGSFTILPQRSGRSGAEYICTEFEIEVRLAYRPTILNPWPTVRETGGRVQEIMRKWDIKLIEDLHCYPGRPRNRCCLGIKAYAGERIAIVPFLSKMVVPFFYRLAFVERYGLEDARKKLWTEYSHGEEGYAEYQSYVDKMMTRPRSSPCVCMSGRKFKRCCLGEMQLAGRIFRQT